MKSRALEFWVFSQKPQDIHTPQALLLTPGGMEGDLRVVTLERVGGT